MRTTRTTSRSSLRRGSLTAVVALGCASLLGPVTAQAAPGTPAAQVEPDHAPLEALEQRFISSYEHLVQRASASLWTLTEGLDAAAATWVQFHVAMRDAVRSTVVSADSMLSSQALALVAASLAAGGPMADLSVLSAAPVPGVESSGYGWRSDPLEHYRKFHKGTDYRAPQGTPVYAAGDGLVIWAGEKHGYGTCIYIDHGGGVITRYGHLSRIRTRKGDAVAAGALVGNVGHTGRATGPHLHYEIRIDGRAVDPVLGMQVAVMQRTAPDEAALAYAALSPAAMAASLDRQDPLNRQRARGGARAAHDGQVDHVRSSAAHRPERRGRGKRDRNLW